MLSWAHIASTGSDQAPLTTFREQIFTEVDIADDLSHVSLQL